MITMARHPGPGSGCQGCDPDVPVPKFGDPIFICALCLRWMELQYPAQVTDPDQLVARRAALAAPLESDAA